MSGHAVLAALIEGHASPAEMADLAKGRLREKRERLVKALEGRVKPHHRFLLTELLCQIDNLEETIGRFDEQIATLCGPFEVAIALLDTIPGVARQTAEIIVSEIGIDMSRFPSAAHMAVAHSILVIAHHLIKRQEPYRELGGDYFDQRRPEATAKRLLKRLQKLGYEIVIQAQPIQAAA